jgi:hypothetical protein
MKPGIFLFGLMLIGAIGFAGCAPAAPLSSSAPTRSGQANQDIPFDLIEKLAVDMAVWHFDSSGDVDGILADAQALGITLSAQDLNCILDEDERKRLWRVGAAEYNVGRLFGEEAQAFFKVRHYVYLAGLWENVVDTAGTLTERKGYIMIVGGNIGIAARVLREVPSRWDCWDVTACEPRPPMRPVTFSLDEEIILEGEKISTDLLDLSRLADPSLEVFHPIMEKAFAWDIRVREVLEQKHGESTLMNMH